MIKRVYLAGPMAGIPYFNFPEFNDKAAYLRSMGWYVFNPAERDNEYYATDISAGNDTGSVEQAVTEHGFDLRNALGEDTAFICDEADAIAMMPGWEKSKGARAEWALAQALELKTIYL